MKLADNTYPDDDQQAPLGQGQRMKPFRLAALSLALLTTFTLVGCDNSDDKSQAAAPAASTASTPKAAENPPLKRWLLATQSQESADPAGCF